MKPKIGRIVQYRLTAYDAANINRRRSDAAKTIARLQNKEREPDGSIFHYGNFVNEGDVFPMMIVRVWNPEGKPSVNGQVLLDGNDHLWVTSVFEGEKNGEWQWPVRDPQ